MRETGWNTWIPAFDDHNGWYIDVVDENASDPEEFVIFSIPVDPLEPVHKDDEDVKRFREWYEEYKKEKEKEAEEEVEGEKAELQG